MPLLMQCACGKTLRVQDELAGYQITCPACSQTVDVPRPAPHLPREPRRPPGRHQGRRRGARAAEGEGGGRTWWPWVAGGAGLAGLLALVLVILLNNRGHNPEEKRRPEGKGPEQATVIPPVEKPPPALVNQTGPTPGPAGKADPLPPGPKAMVPPVPKPADPSPVAPADKKTPILKPLTAAEEKLRGSFSARLVQIGTASAGGWKELEGRPLVGVVVELEARAATSVALTSSSATAFAGTAEHPAVLVFIAGDRGGLAGARSFKGTTTQSGTIGVGAEKFKFDLPPLNAMGNSWLLLPVLLEGKPGIEYSFRGSGKVRFGFLFAARKEDLTGVRVLGHAFAMDGTAQQQVAQEPRAEESPSKPPPKTAGPLDGPGPTAAEPANAPEVYRYQPGAVRAGKSRNVQIVDNPNGTRTVTGLGKGSALGAYRGPDGQLRVVPDMPGSTGLHIVVKRKPGFTKVAGLRFKKNATVSIWEDGVVQVNRTGVPATDENGDRYVSRSVTVDGRKAIVMVRVPDRPDRPAPRPVEKSPEDKNEQLAAAKLKLAQYLAKDGVPDKARSYCEEILARYPKTRAAAEAKALLEKLKKK